MRTPHDRSGFTLMETMVSTAIATIVMFALACAFLFCQRMFRLTMAESESTLALREVRDKLLFRAGPGLSSGLLTGKASADSASITMNWEDTVEGPDKIRLVWQNDTSGGYDSDAGYFFNERVAHTGTNTKWFKPSGFFMQQDWAHAVDLPRIRIDLVSHDDSTVKQTSWILLPQ